MVSSGTGHMGHQSDRLSKKIFISCQYLLTREARSTGTNNYLGSGSPECCTNLFCCFGFFKPVVRKTETKLPKLLLQAILYLLNQYSAPAIAAKQIRCSTFGVILTSNVVKAYFSFLSGGFCALCNSTGRAGYNQAYRIRRFRGTHTVCLYAA